MCESVCKTGDKKRIAILFGGCSTEYEVSLQSAAAVLKHLDAGRFDVLPIGITREGDWYHYTGRIESILDDSWHTDRDDLYPVVVSPSRSAPGFFVWKENAHRRIEVDIVFPVLHGKNGEDGTVQGLFELAGVSVIGCDMLSSALCMDKDRAHRLGSLAGIA
ncbi:MAG: hypothetical protein K2H40_07660, partial [Lachnospiraceae bacterium]|nr:hypothetical protein [Lachnospiraceae bacterium]